jgi:hypothetical protein
MLRTALTLGLLTFATTPEAHPLPADVKAARVLGGTALLVTADAPQGRLTLLPEGVYFAASGYEALDVATKQLQASLRAMEARVRGYELAAITPCPEEAPAIRKGWSTSDLLVAVLAGVVIGAGGIAVIQAARTP